MLNLLKIICHTYVWNEQIIDFRGFSANFSVKIKSTRLNPALFDNSLLWSKQSLKDDMQDFFMF